MLCHFLNICVFPGERNKKRALSSPLPHFTRTQESTMSEKSASDAFLRREIRTVQREAEKCALYCSQERGRQERTRQMWRSIADMTMHASANGTLLALAAAIGQYPVLKPLLGATCIAGVTSLLLTQLTGESHASRTHAWFADRVATTDSKLKSIAQRVGHEETHSPETVRATFQEITCCHTDLVDAASTIRLFPMGKVFAE